MTNIGLLPESVVRKNIAKIIRLMGIKKDLASRIPANEVERACLPIQQQAVREEIRLTLRYLRQWHVNIKARINDEN